MLGEGHVPQLLSDKVIVTPPYGGNKRGALWAENKNTLNDWTVDLDFRAGGADRGGGNLQLWFVKDGQTTVGTTSIYTVGRFDGLALVVDTHNGKQSIRGFLNDGSTEYRSHANVDSLAFGHCDYVYRNLGRPSRLRLKSTSGGLEVTIDEQPCFSSSKIALPTDYYFGLTAASADPPDSFEVFKFVLGRTTSTAPPSQPGSGQMPIPNQGGSVPEPNNIPASHSSSQSEDLTNKLNLLSTALNSLYTQVTQQTTNSESRHQEILRQLSALPTQLNPASQGGMSNIDARLTSIERALSTIQSELHSGDHKSQFAALTRQVNEMNVGMTEHLPNRVRGYIQDHTPRVGFMITSFMIFQLVLVAFYVLYKRRRANAPKKYL